MGNIRYLTVDAYAQAWGKHPQTIYLRISLGKILVVSEPGGGRGKLIPVCDCKTNLFPGKGLCDSCEDEFKKRIE